MDYAPTFGIETHAQLLTASKMFCSCRTDYAARPPNSLVCPVCLGMPGALPVINRRAVECVIMTGLALNCHIAELSRFERKNYNYPDLVKGYQISQYDLPLCRDGWLPVGTRQTDGGTEYRPQRIRIHDVHLEEDTGKLVHVPGQSRIDFNRSGIPLMEIVSEPDLASLDEVREYVLKLRRILRYLGVSSGNMEDGAMRFEANISLHPVDSSEKGTRVEVKNLNSFRALLRSLEYEIQRQGNVLRAGGTIDRETRGWDDVRGVTFVQRSKEAADDYRYFPEPDLPPLRIAPEWVQSTMAAMPELPDERYARFTSIYGLADYDAQLLAEECPVADYFERAVAAGQDCGVAPKAIANWVTGELFHLLHDEHEGIGAIRIAPQQLVELVALLQAERVTMSTAKHVLGIMFRTGRSAPEVVADEGIEQIHDAHRLAVIVEEVIAAHADVVAQYKGGKETVLRFLVGQVMKATKGQADPQLAAELLQRRMA